MRSSEKSFALLCQIRRWSALCFCRNIRPSVRWIFSELNPADIPSRFSDPQVLPHDDPHLADPQTPTEGHANDSHVSGTHLLTRLSVDPPLCDAMLKSQSVPNEAESGAVAPCGRFAECSSAPAISVPSAGWLRCGGLVEWGPGGWKHRPSDKEKAMQEASERPTPGAPHDAAEHR